MQTLRASISPGRQRVVLALGWRARNRPTPPLATLSRMLKVLATASNPVERSLLLARLSDAGIPCMCGAGGGRGALGSGRDILVEEEDLARAQEILKEEDEGFDEKELARLSEEAGQQTAEAIPSLTHPAPRDQTGSPPPVEAQAPAKRHGLLKAFERLTMDKDETNSPFGR